MLGKKLKERKKAQSAGGSSGQNDSGKATTSALVEVNPNNAPKPSPPKTKKDLLCSASNVTLFGQLELHVVNMKLSYTTFAELMDVLHIRDLTDLEKARILFHWITAQNINTLRYPKTLSLDTPLGFLKAIKDNEECYAGLFLRLCCAAGLYAKVIKGYLKGANYNPDYRFKESDDPNRGKWNAVLIDDQWRLVDTHWGSRHILEDDENPDEDLSSRVKYKYEEHFFLTDPEVMINSHFPDESDWQLLRYPIRLDQFEKSTKQWPLFYKLELLQSSHQSGLVDANGQVQVKLKVSDFARSDTKFKVELRSRNQHTSRSNDMELQKYVLHHSTDEEEIFDVFPPRVDEFLLKVFGLSRKFCDGNMFNNICLYQITCSKVKAVKTVYQPPFPVVNESYGPNLSTNEVGVKAISHKGPVVQCDDRGQTTVVLSFNKSSENIVFSEDLRDSDSVVQEGCVVHAIIHLTSEKRLIVYVRVPKNGTYALTLYSNVNSPNGNMLSSFCHYLISSEKMTKEKSEPFPQVPNGKLGILQPGFDDVGLTLRSPKTELGPHWVTANELGESSFVFQHRQPLVFNVGLATHSTPFDDYVAVQTDGKYSVIIVRTPPNMEEGSVLRLKVFAAPVERTRDVPCVFVGFITCQASSQNVPPWPQPLTRTWGIVADKWEAKSLTSLHFLSSTTARRSEVDVEGYASPFRSYPGGNELKIELQHTLPIQIKPKLNSVNERGKAGTELENLVMVSKNSATSTQLIMRFPEKGIYSLALYGELADKQKAQLTPVYYAVIEAEKPSVCIEQFPETFALWTTSCSELRSPLTAAIKRNKPITFKVTLGSFAKDAQGAYSASPYHKVLLVVDGNTSVEPVKESSCDFEWRFTSAAEEEKVGIAIQTSATKNAVNYVLQFEIVD